MEGLSLRRMKDGMNKNPGYYCPGIEQPAEHHRQVTMIFGLNH
jgi:hypothetical protein